MMKANDFSMSSEKHVLEIWAMIVCTQAELLLKWNVAVRRSLRDRLNPVCREVWETVEMRRSGMVTIA